jgi:hypothetical protein
MERFESLNAKQCKNEKYILICNPRSFAHSQQVATVLPYSLLPSYPLSCPLASSEERGEEARGQDRAIGREERGERKEERGEEGGIGLSLHWIIWL